MRKSIYIFLFALIIYLLIATILPQPSIVGKVGEFLGNADFKLFAYLAYVFPILLGILLYLGYKKRFDADISMKVLGGVFLFFDLLFLQAAMFHKGVIGNLFVETLKNYIGIAGVGLLIFVLFLWSVFLLFEDRILDMFHKKETSNNEKNKVSERNYNESLEFDNDVSNIELDEDITDKVEVNDNKEKLAANDEIISEKDILTSNEDIVEDIKNNDENEEAFIKNEDLKQNTNENETHHVTHVEELEDTKKLLSEIETGEREKPKNWKFPPLDFLSKPKSGKKEINEAEIDKKIKILIEKLKQFKIEGDVVRYYVGPVVTTFEFKPLPHIKVSKILSLQDDLAMALKAQSIRIQAPIPGKDVVGIEIPNEKVETIYLREILESDIFKKAKSPLTIALGKDIVGAPFVTDLKKLPHLLIAGTTGSGKSVGINAMILSLLYRNSPDELKFLMIDPKMLEFSIFNDIPHLLTPVITEPKKAIMALNSMVKEMERRYKLMSKARVKNIEGYNAKVSENEKMPYIVIIIDELADLMMTSGKDVEYSIARLAQMARASGIHLIVATQRPSVDVVTGLIKANLPSRISFKVGQKIDSKVILDQFGAESLLGRGDMLFTPPGITGLIRLHAPFTSEDEIEKVVEYLKSQRNADYDTIIVNTIAESEMLEEIDDLDELFEEAKEIILKEKRTSISYLQRRLNIGYNRAANIIEQMERMGILSSPNAKGQREILI
ncbi:DNA translocase FtsK [Nautilia profundicola]|uniref:DNA translocase FtsK n=1 Tax=Nautilia profundicola TaxID=244787 RepID=UPI001E4E4B5C|nr:DNA translocase FtsK [Nautilia profundicola]